MGCGASTIQGATSDPAALSHQQPIPQHVLTDETEAKNVILGESPRGTNFFYPVMAVPVAKLMALPRMLPHEEMKEHLVEWTPKLGKLLLLSHQVATHSCILSACDVCVSVCSRSGRVLRNQTILVLPLNECTE